MTNKSYEERRVLALESIAVSLKTIAEKPPVNMQIMSPVGVDIETTEGRTVNAETRNTRVQKWCSFCGAEFLGEPDDGNTLCDECKEDSI